MEIERWDMRWCLRLMVRSMDSLGEVKLAVLMHWDFHDLGLKVM